MCDAILEDAIKTSSVNETILQNFIDSDPSSHRLNYYFGLSIIYNNIFAIEKIQTLIQNDTQFNSNISIFLFNAVHYNSLEAFEYLLKYTPLLEEHIHYCIHIIYYEYLDFGKDIDFIKLFYTYYPALIEETSNEFIRFIGTFYSNKEFNQRQTHLLKYLHSIHPPILQHICEDPTALLHLFEQSNTDAVRYIRTYYHLSYDALISKLKKHADMLTKIDDEMLIYLIVTYNLLPTDIPHNHLRRLTSIYNKYYIQKLITIISL